MLDKVIDPGAMDEIIDVYGHTVTGTNDFKEDQKSRVLFKRLWAKREDFASQEGEEGRQIVASDEIVFVTHYISGVLHTHEVYYEGEYYDITSVKPMGRREYLQIKCKIKDNA